MKRIIETELPEIFDEEFIELAQLLDCSEIEKLKGIAIGMLLSCGRYSPDQIISISAKHKAEK